MKEVLIWMVVAGLLFLTFVLRLGFGLYQKNTRLKWAALAAFIGFVVAGGFAGYLFIKKSYHVLTAPFKARTGIEIYEALFDKSTSNCVNILHYKDQLVPRLDVAIWLHFKLCPAELRRLLARQNYTNETVILLNSTRSSVDEATIEWFRPSAMGDTILVFQYTSDDYRNFQTLWVSADSTEVYCKDALD